MKPKSIAIRKFFLWTEMFGLFVGFPLLAYFTKISRWQIILALWLATIYATYILMRQKEFSWQKIWQGKVWTKGQKVFALLRFAIASFLIIIFTVYYAPERLFQFPLQKPVLWLVVMFLYPLLSALPQEFVYRTFFFIRYKSIIPNIYVMIAISAFCFGFVHIMFNNWIAPVFSGIGGILFGLSYSQHRSLKWVSIEHAIYGCYIFTVGLGWYFYGSAGR